MNGRSSASSDSGGEGERGWWTSLLSWREEGQTLDVNRKVAA